ncbi:MAG: glycosyltransferase family 2 protein, partial [Thermomicrobiales bacterium]
MTAPMIAVIVSTWNLAPSLRITLESLRRQEFQAWEAIVVGDACTDGTAEVVAQIGDPRIRWHNRPENGGSQAFANPDGIERTTAPWIAYLGHDDLWFPWHLGEMADTAQRTGAEFVQALTLYFGPQGITRCYGFRSEEATAELHPAPPRCWMHQRALLDRCGGWRDPATLNDSPDQELMRRFGRAGVLFACSQRLSVLKFPAGAFGGIYRNDQPPLHAGMARMLAIDPLWLERKLLQEAVLITAEQQATSTAERRAGLDAARDNPASIAAYQEHRRGNFQHRGITDAPEPVSPPVIRLIAPDTLRAPDPLHPDSDPVRLRVDVHGLTHEPLVLVGGVPLETRQNRPGVLEASIPP